MVVIKTCRTFYFYIYIFFYTYGGVSTSGFAFCFLHLKNRSGSPVCQRPNYTQHLQNSNIFRRTKDDDWLQRRRLVLIGDATWPTVLTNWLFFHSDHISVYKTNERGGQKVAGEEMYIRNQVECPEWDRSCRQKATLFFFLLSSSFFFFVFSLYVTLFVV